MVQGRYFEFAWHGGPNWFGTLLGLSGIGEFGVLAFEVAKPVRVEELHDECFNECESLSHVRFGES